MNLIFKNAKVFSREELKQIRGGDDYYEAGDVETPFDTGSSGGIAQTRKRCCKNNDHSVCSACVLVGDNAYCPASGTFLTSSGCPN